MRSQANEFAWSLILGTVNQYIRVQWLKHCYYLYLFPAICDMAARMTGQPRGWWEFQLPGWWACQRYGQLWYQPHLSLRRQLTAALHLYKAVNSHIIIIFCADVIIIIIYIILYNIITITYIIITYIIIIYIIITYIIIIIYIIIIKFIYW